MREGERLLDDLSTCTNINTVEVLNYHSPSIEQASFRGTETPAQQILPAERAFDKLRVPIVKKDKFDSMMKFLESAKSRGFKIACNLVPIWMGVEQPLPLGCVDIEGRRVPAAGDFAVYGCPNNPDVIRYGKTLVNQIATSWSSLDLVAINHVEYPHLVFQNWPKVNLGDLFVCFCEYCRKEADESGLDFGRMKHEARSMFDFANTSLRKSQPLASLSPIDLFTFLVRRPLLTAWLNFRMTSMTYYIKGLVEAARQAAKDSCVRLKIGMEFQLPALSNLVGTDFLALCPVFDWLTPKFPDYITGSIIPIIADQIAPKRSELDRSALRAIMREILGLGAGPRKYKSLGGLKHAILYSNTFDGSIIDRQMKCIQPLVGKIPLYPYVWEHNNDIKSLAKRIEALKRNGFDGYMTWCWEEGLAREQLRAWKGIL